MISVENEHIQKWPKLDLCKFQSKKTFYIYSFFHKFFNKALIVEKYVAARVEISIKI